MPAFDFEAYRSVAAADQAPGIKCSKFTFSGSLVAHSINAVRDICVTLMVIPGVYRLAVRNCEPCCEWKNFPAIDTRNPEAAAEAVVKAKKKAKRSRQ